MDHNGDARDISSTTNRPIRALVLPGGGGRGAYQVGVVKALHEIGLEFDMAFGTSIGGLNATLYAQGNVARMEELWSNIRPKDVYRLPSAQQLSHMLLGHKLGLLDTSPLEELLRREADLQKLKASRTKVGLFTTDLCSLETRLITTDDIMSTGELIDVLMATSAVPMAFPPRHLHGKGLWVDGGLVRNTPLQAAIDRGAQEIFTVLLHPDKVEACPTNMWQVIARCLDIVLDASAKKEIDLSQLYNRLIEEGAQEARGLRKVDIHVFQPHEALDTTLLEIDPERSRRLIKHGYDDAMLQLEQMKSAKAAMEAAPPEADRFEASEATP
jgi:NTE family protein